MTSFTTLVSIELDVGPKLAKFISSKLSEEEGNAFLSKAEQLLSSKNTKGAIDHLLSKIDVFLGLTTEQGNFELWGNCFNNRYLCLFVYHSILNRNGSCVSVSFLSFVYSW